MPSKDLTFNLDVRCDVLGNSGAIRSPLVFMTTSDNTWSTFESTSNDNVGRHQDIRWATVKTEEEEYLDKLQSKLARVMSGGFKSSKPDNDRLGVGHDERHDELVAMPLPPDDDEGLHLLYDQPQTTYDIDATVQTAGPSRPPVSAATITLVETHETPEDDTEDGRGDAPESPARRRTVRFRSRVRITSGIHSLSRSSSAGGSAASSISVPLRGTENEPAFLHPGSTASRHSLPPSDTTGAWLGGTSAARREKRRANPAAPRSPADERTPLLVPGASTCSAQPRPAAAGTENPEEEELDRVRMAARKTEEQVVFGKWPARLFNRHWWWWKIEPLLPLPPSHTPITPSDQQWPTLGPGPTTLIPPDNSAGTPAPPKPQNLATHVDMANAREYARGFSVSRQKDIPIPATVGEISDTASVQCGCEFQRLRFRKTAAAQLPRLPTIQVTIWFLLG
ncbi:hypothetical protein BU17DRAFT_84062 [Hysterangium stoloniferum]|nr:hypothetical protein BU17DRAFT_84062 [Hysterangium stoloniferum]